ncbi:YdbH domain-containing protein [uncultured Caulobacter sp.]|uniref:intermembrane phospholipid transport protein YdbH family protein n=1 Tax=uncultured Caulobacter sp. TaxID=158749 RepID=UPI0026175902|nr:YdbH domain-containing protein [uncultured Caulobacter sp.]
MAEPAPAPSSTRRARLVDLGLEAVSLSMLAFIATGLVTWSGRREIGRDLAEAWLRDHGVEAVVALDEVDATGFTGKVRLGPRNAPVFAADRLEVAYDLSTPWAGGAFGFRTRAVRLVRPRVLASLDAEGRPRFGALQPLIDQALKAPRRPNVPGPAILIEDGRLDLTTPGGLARITGDASLDDGQLLRFDGRLAPLRYAASDLVLDGRGASASARKRGDRLTVEAMLSIDSLESRAADLTDATAKLSADLPYPDLATRRASGPLEARLSVRAADGRLSDNGAEDLAGDLVLTGRVDGGPAAFAFLGRARGALRSGRLSAPTLDARDAGLTFDASRIVVGRREGRTTGRGAVSAELRAGQALAAGTATRDLTARAASSNLALVLAPDGAALNGPLELKAEAGRAARGALALSAARLNARGRIDQRRGDLTLALAGDLTGRSGVSRPDAERLAARIPNPGYAKPLSEALRTFTLSAPAMDLSVKSGRTRLMLGRDARVVAPNGASLTVAAPGGPLLDAGPEGARGVLRADLSGGGLPKITATAPGWRAAGGVVTSPLALRIEGFDLPPIRGVSGAIDGRARFADGRFVLTTARCVPVTAKTYALGENPVTDLAASLCPAKAPLVTASAAGWSAALRFEDGQGTMSAAQAKLQGGKGEASLGGSHGFERAIVRMDSGAVADAAPQRRFNPILAKGALALADGLWSGTFQAATPVGAPLGEIRLRHVVATGQGQADIDASKLTFAPGGLQPADLTPMAAFARDAKGPASFAGVFAWDKQGVTSRGRLVADRIDFTSPIGFVATLDGAIDFDGLAPLSTRPGQSLRVVKIDSLVPLTGVESVFQLGADVLHVSKATFEAAKGRVSIEPIDVPLGVDKTISGAIVIQHLDLGELIAASSVADKVKLDAIVDGRLPFTFGPEGLRFHEGRISAVQAGRVEIARTALTGVAASPADSPGAPPKPPAQVNAIQDFAYQAMENLAFDQLEAGVNSTDQGRLSILFHIKGRHDPKVAEKARVGILDLLRGRAFNKRIALPAKTPVDLTLDASLNFDELLAAWRRTFAVDQAAAKTRSGPVQP